MTTATQNWFDWIASIFGTVTGIESVHAAGEGTDPDSVAVEPQVDQLEQTPAAFLGHGGIDPIIHGPWQRQTHNLLGSIWLPRNPIDEQFAKAIDLIDPVMRAFEDHVKSATHPRVQSVVLQSFEGISARAWPPDSNRWFLVMNWPITAQVNLAVEYTPA